MSDAGSRPDTVFVLRPEGERLAYRYLPGGSPTVVFLSGYASDMSGNKATYLQERCALWGHAYLCLDYRGHGLSDGRFEDYTIGDWCDDARRVIEQVTRGSLVLVGSSMGGWIMLLLSRIFGDRIAGLVGVGAAPDFTRDTMPQRLDDEHRVALAKDGIAYLPNRYGPKPSVVTARLLADGNERLVLSEPLKLTCPVRLVHGMADPDVSWHRSMAICDAVAGDDVRVVLVKNGEHRLSSPAELDLIADQVGELLGRSR